MKRILFGISGSIAAFRALDVMRLLVADGIQVIPILSKGGAEFVTRTSVQALTGQPAITEVFPETPHPEIEHIVLAQDADLMVTCPASADIIAKYAHGISDDPLALIAITYGTPHMIAPAMNPHMWSNPATAANVETLKSRDFEFIGPDKGGVACGDEGWGRLSPVEEIYGRIRAALGRNGPLAGKKVLVSAGGTKEPVDDFRFLTNYSTGRMGGAVARAARDLGADVTLVTASDMIPVSLTAGINMRIVTTAADMHAAMLQEADNSDIIIMSAAVADFTPSSKVDGKIKKEDGLDSIPLKRTADILKDLGERKGDKQILVGFAAEIGENAKSEALRKCVEKNCDLMCLNDVSVPGIGFGADDNEVLLVYPDGTEQPLPRGSKNKVAVSILNQVVGMMVASQES